MTEWFRSWHGAPTDAKWLVVSRKAGATPAIVSAIAWALFDYASQHEERGTVTGFDVETYSVWSGVSEAEIEAVIAAMEAKGIIVDGHLAAWEKRQPKREDDSTPRVRAFRQRQAAAQRDETQRNAPEKSREDESTPPISPPEPRPADGEVGREIIAARKTTKHRGPEPLRDALVTALSLRVDCMTRPEYARLLEAVAAIRDAGGRPEEIPRAVTNYRTRYPRADCTPTGIAGNWSRLLETTERRGFTSAAEQYGRLA